MTTLHIWYTKKIIKKMDKNKNERYVGSIVQKCSEINRIYMGIGTAETTVQGGNGKMRQINKIMNMGKCLVSKILTT